MLSAVRAVSGALATAPMMSGAGTPGAGAAGAPCAGAVMGGEFDTELRARAVTGQDDTRLAIVRAHCIAEAVQYASLPLQREVWR